MARLLVLLAGVALMVGPAFLLGAGETQPAGTVATSPGSSTLPAPQVVLLQIFRSPAEDRDKSRLILSDNRYSNEEQTSPGVKIVLDIPLPPEVVEVPKSITLSSFVDDKNRDLGPGTKPKADYDTGNETPPISLMPGGADCIFKIYSTVFPAHDATAINVKGKIPVQVGSGEKTFTQKDLLLRLGKTVVAGPVKLTIASLSEPYHREGSAEGLQVSFTSEGSLNQLKSLEFLDESGMVIPFTQQYRTNNPQDSWNKVSGIGGTLATRPHAVTVRVTTYDKVETVDIPLDLSVKVGI